MLRPDLREALLAMAAEDDDVRATLAADGSLFGGYHPRMEAVHRRNAARLRAIMDDVGWPGRALVGEDGAQAAWLVLQHAIGEPALQRGALPLLRDAAARGDVPAAHVAMLDDRIRTLEGRPQRYGTQLDWDDAGELSPLPIEQPERVDALRADAGLGPLAEHVAALRTSASRSGERPPADPAQRRSQMEEWARRVGWRS